MASLKPTLEKWKEGQSFLLRYRVNGVQLTKGLGKVSKKVARDAMRTATLQEKSKGAVTAITIDVTDTDTGITFNKFLDGGWESNTPGYLNDYAQDHPRSEGDIRSRFRENGLLRKTFGPLRIGNGQATVDQWVKTWKKFKGARLEEVGPVALQRDFQYLRAALNRAARDYRLCKVSPLATAKFDVEVITRPKGFLLPEDLKAIYAESEEIHAAEFRFGANTGLRRGEYPVLEKTRVGRDEMEIITPKTDQKGVAVRHIGLDESAQDARDHILWRSESGKLFFEPRSLDTWGNRFRTARDKAAKKLTDDGKEVSDALERGTFNWLRHTYISALVNDAKIPLPVVADLAGHTDIKTTMTYIHVTDQHKKDATAALSQLGY
tara:strand:+ start:1644 stop:2780 length:1137 start_codon:yes stop_codon:yes gene_type:complete